MVKDLTRPHGFGKEKKKKTQHQANNTAADDAGRPARRS
jgi:hypothetical protein